MEQPGHQFDDQLTSQNPYDPSGDQARREADRRRAMKDIVVGLLFVIIGAAITWFTYQQAQDGGRFVVTWGLVLVGLFQAGKGAFNYMKSGQ